MLGISVVAIMEMLLIAMQTSKIMATRLLTFIHQTKSVRFASQTLEEFRAIIRSRLTIRT
jgi:hypothetical protein